MRILTLVLATWLSAAIGLWSQVSSNPGGATTSQNSSERLLVQAQLLLRDGKLTEALPLVQQLLKDRPDSPDGHVMLGFIFFKQSKAADSLREYLKAAALRDLTAFELKIVALNYAMLEDYQNADRGLTRAIEMNPRDLQACNYLGEVKFLQEKYEAAIELFRHSLSLDPQNVFASNGLGGACEQMNRLEEADAAYRHAIEGQVGKAVQDPTPVLNLGRLLLKLGRNEEALSYLTMAVRLGPEHAETHEQLGKAHSYAGELEAAQRELEKAIRLNPRDAHLHYVLGQLYQRGGKPDQANYEFDQYQALQKHPDPTMDRP
jgi:Flp pilus assembly protein TadD